MSTGYTRREYLGLVGSTALLPLASNLAHAFGSSGAQAGVPAKEAMRGAFLIMQTPYTTSKAVDYQDLAAEVDWAEECRIQGIVWPQNSSDYPRLTKDEIPRGMEVITKAHKGKRSALVLGVQQPDTKGMVEMARFAETLAPDAFIAMPPTGVKAAEEYREYYGELASLTKRPIFVQTVPDTPGTEFTVDLILELAAKYPNLGYVKEEHAPIFERMGKLMERRPATIQRVFGGTRGRTWPYEMRLGTDGTMNGFAMYGEVFPKMWSLFQEKNLDELRDLHGRVLLMLGVESEIPGTGRYLLQKRGIFKTSVSRGREVPLTPTQMEYIDHSFRALQPYLLRRKATSL